MLNKKKAYLPLIIIGIILFIAGFSIKVPGAVLTTHDTLNGDKAEDYNQGSSYTAIDEYVGGDAYNYIIGASLTSGKISGAMASKAVCFVGGAVLIAFGLTFMILFKTDSAPEKSEENSETAEEPETEQLPEQENTGL